MAYGSVIDPVAGTVITVSYAVSNILDPIRWLRLMTGNADPPGSNYVVVSDSATGTTWKRIPADALDAGVVVANLGFTPLNKAGDTITGTLISSVITGTAPFTIASQTKVANLNVDKLDDADATATPTPGAIPIADSGGRLDGWISVSASYVQRPATIRYWAGHSSLLVAELAADGGWLECNGQSVLRASYPALFNALGGTSSPYGLPDGTHFNVPDDQDRSPVGKSSTKASGATGGNSTVNLDHHHATSHGHSYGGTTNESGSATASSTPGGGTITGLHHTHDYGGSTSVDTTDTADALSATQSMYHPYITRYVLIKT